MKTCTSCMESLPIDSFSYQKKNPSKRYAWCDECRAAQMPRIKPFRIPKNEAQILREKAISLRAFNDPAAVALLKEYQGGVKMKELAIKHNRHPETIRKTINRAKRIVSTSETPLAH